MKVTRLRHSYFVDSGGGAKSLSCPPGGDALATLPPNVTPECNTRQKKTSHEKVSTKYIRSIKRYDAKYRQEQERHRTQTKFVSQEEQDRFLRTAMSLSLIHI